MQQERREKEEEGGESGGWFGLSSVGGYVSGLSFHQQKGVDEFNC